MRLGVGLGVAAALLFGTAADASREGEPPSSGEVRVGGQAAAEALLDRVLKNRDQVRSSERELTFRQLITTERLNRERAVVATTNALYEYTPVAGRHLWKLLELDGKPISGRRERREERRYRKAVEAAHKEAAEDRRAAERQDPHYEVRPKNGMDLFYKIVADAIELEMFEGTLFAGHKWRGRPMQVVRFRPRPAFRRAPNRMMSVVAGTEGELWVDTQAWQIARVRAVLTRGQNFLAGLFGRLHEGTSADVESEFNGRIWLPERVTMSVDARVFFFRRIRRRVHYDFLSFRSVSGTPASEATAQHDVRRP